MSARLFNRITKVLGALFLPLLTACGGNDDSDNIGGTETSQETITLDPSIGEMTSTRGTASNTWTVGDKVAVMIGSTVKEYSVDSKKRLTSASPFAWNTDFTDHVQRNLSAWYPYSASLSTSRSVQSNQTSGLDGSDFLYGQTTVTYHSGDWVYPIKFYHQVAKFTIDITLESGYSGSVSSVTIGGLACTGTFSAPSSGNIGSWSSQSNTTTIQANGNGTSWTALIIPQSIASGNHFTITMTMTAGDTYVYTSDATITAITGGQNYQYSFTLNKNDLRSAVTVSPWTTGTSNTLNF